MKHFVFDFDGTIADNFGLVSQLVHRFLDKEGVTMAKSDDEFRKLGVRATMEELKISRATLLRMVFTIKKQIHQRLLEFPPHDDLKSVLRSLHQTGRLFILSTNKRNNIKEYLKKYGMTDYFDEIFEDRSYFGKASELRKIQQHQHIGPLDIYYIGDESRDVEAAKKAGCHSVAVLWGYEGEKPLRDAKPDYLIRHPKELLSLISD